MFSGVGFLLVSVCFCAFVDLIWFIVTDLGALFSVWVDSAMFANDLFCWMGGFVAWVFPFYSVLMLIVWVLNLFCIASTACLLHV